MTTKVSRGSTVLFKPGPPPGEIPYYLDVPTFQVALDTALKNNTVVGYAAQLRQHGQILFTNAWQYARRPQDQGSELWTPYVQMHVASVSKLMTAMAMMVLFRDHNISDPPWDAPIINYLPHYWQKGPDIQFITFLNLFQHTSGLSTPPTPVTFQSMQSAIATGINPGNLGLYSYQNVNYALCRILLPVINGDIDQGADPSNWDYGTIRAYEAYLQAKVFLPSGVVSATLDHQPACALAYGYEGDPTPGWNSGNIEESCGCDGWHLSVSQLLDVMGEFRRDGGILTPAAALAMLDIGFGVDPLTTDKAPLPTALPTPAGNLYCKPGDWHDNTYRDEQSLAYFLPEDMELAVFVNSTVDGLNGTANDFPNYFRHLVTQTYLDNLTTQPPVHL
jgi:hypothetical protein